MTEQHDIVQRILNVKTNEQRTVEALESILAILARFEAKFNPPQLPAVIEEPSSKRAPRRGAK